MRVFELQRVVAQAHICTVADQGPIEDSLIRLIVLEFMTVDAVHCCLAAQCTISAGETHESGVAISYQYRSVASMI